MYVCGSDRQGRKRGGGGDGKTREEFDSVVGSRERWTRGDGLDLDIDGVFNRRRERQMDFERKIVWSLSKVSSVFVFFSDPYCLSCYLSLNRPCWRAMVDTEPIILFFIP